MSELTSLQLAHRINSEGTDDSPFGSALNTPADERPPILDFDKAFNERLVGVDVISDGREIIRKELGLVNDTSISSLDLNHSCKVDDDDHFNVAGKGGVARYRDEVASLEKGHGEELSTSNSPTSTAEEAENDEHEDGVVAISPLLESETLETL
ncbi:hypothetical protein L218DRAFT_556263 [Marasmius fiardii PR-910]|nr:hypothetical protein L218DRAFT_556263 [Marasmius fiardii PR-910]